MIEVPSPILYAVGSAVLLGAAAAILVIVGKFMRQMGRVLKGREPF